MSPCHVTWMEVKTCHGGRDFTHCSLLLPSTWGRVSTSPTPNKRCRRISGRDCREPGGAHLTEGMLVRGKKKPHASRHYLASSWQLLWLNKQGYLWMERKNDYQATLMSSSSLWYCMFCGHQDADNSFWLSTSYVLPIQVLGPLMTLEQWEVCVNVHTCPSIMLPSNLFFWIP